MGGLVELRLGLRKRLRLGSELLLLWTGEHMSLAFKLVLPVLVSTVVLVAVLGTIVANEVQSQIQDAYDREAQQAAAGVEAMWLQHPGDVNEMNDYLARLVAARRDLVSVRIIGLDAGTTVIASSRPSEVGFGGVADTNEMRAAWEGRQLELENEGGYLVTVYPLRDGQSLLFGAILITSSKSAELAATQAITKTIVIVGVIAIAIDSAMIMSALYFGIIRRTRRVQRAVEAVGRGDTSIRLPESDEPRGRDEVFNLARTVGRMIESLDERKRGDSLIRRLGQRALAGTAPEGLIGDGLTATREALGLEACIFTSVGEDGSMGGWLDGSGSEKRAMALPIWVFALTRVAVEARRAVVTDRQGQASRFVEGVGSIPDAQVFIVPLPRTSKAGQAIVAIAPVGETIAESGLPVLDAVAATISERLHMQAAEAARAESAVKSKVMATVSHEMRNPLNSILGFTGLVLGTSSENLTDKQRRQLGFVQTSATMMLNLVNNYLDLAKLRAGSFPVQYETVKLEPMVAEIASVMQPIAAGRKVIIRTAVSPGAEARLDPSRTRQILTNLVSNAIKFTPEGGHVYVRARVDKDSCRLVVSDTGVGIPKDQARLVFTEFAKIDAGALAASKGTGLGLALCKAFAGTMGAGIKFYSRRGRGTTFVVVIPRDGGQSGKSRAA